MEDTYNIRQIESACERMAFLATQYPKVMDIYQCNSGVMEIINTCIKNVNALKKAGFDTAQTEMQLVSILYGHLDTMLSASLTSSQGEDIFAQERFDSYARILLTFNTTPALRCRMETCRKNLGTRSSDRMKFWWRTSITPGFMFIASIIFLVIKFYFLA